MSMNSPHESVKDIVTSVWKNNRALAIAVLIVAVIAGYILYKRSQASIIAPAADATPSATGLPGNTYNNTYTTITGTPGAPGLPGPPGPQGPPGQIQAPGPPPVGVAGLNYGLIPFGKYNGPSYSNLKPNTTFTWAGVKYLLSTGPQGKLYGRDPTGRMWLLYEPASFYPGGANYGK